MSRRKKRASEVSASIYQISDVNCVFITHAAILLSRHVEVSDHFDHKPQKAEAKTSVRLAKQHTAS